MKLIELVKHLKSLKESEKFRSAQLPNIEYDLIDMYMIEKVDLNSEIVFFNERMDFNLTEIGVINVAFVKRARLFRS